MSLLHGSPSLLSRFLAILLVKLRSLISFAVIFILAGKLWAVEAGHDGAAAELDDGLMGLGVVGVDATRQEEP